MIPVLVSVSFRHPASQQSIQTDSQERESEREGDEIEMRCRVPGEPYKYSVRQCTSTMSLTLSCVEYYIMKASEASTKKTHRERSWGVFKFPIGRQWHRTLEVQSKVQERSEKLKDSNTIPS